MANPGGARLGEWRKSASDFAITYSAAAALSLISGAVFIAAFGGDVLVAFGTVLHTSLGTWGGFAQTLNKFTPLLLGSLAVAFGMRGGHFNIGVDGQIYAGAIGTAGTAFALEGLNLPWPVFVPLVMLGGVLAGCFWGFIPGILRARYRVSEIFVTVMLNFIALYLVDFLANGPWNDPMAGEAISLPIPDASVLPQVMPRSGAHFGFIIALAAAVGMYFLMTRTIIGYEVRAVGDNPRAARFGGINVNRVTLIIMPTCGALAGLAGAIEVSGFHQSLLLGITGSEGTPNYGAMAILIAVIGRNNPLGVTVAAAVFAVLLSGSDSLQRSIGLPGAAVFVFQAIIVLTVLYVETRRKMSAG